MATEQALLQIPEEAPAQLEAGAGEQDGDARDVAHITGFAGPLLQLDTWVFYFSCCLHILVAVFLLCGKAYIWFSTLSAIVLLAVADGMVLRLRGQPMMIGDRSIRRFMYGIPLAFFCFYSAAVIHDSDECKWYIVVDNPSLQTAMKVGTYVAGVVVLLSMALAALRMDCNSSASVSRRVRQGRWYALCHVLFRAAELSFRLGIGVVLCESLRLQPMASKVHLPRPVCLCVPFFCMVCFYALILQAANSVGKKPADSLVPCILVGVVTLAMNPMHFFARQGYDAVVQKFNKWLFLVRVLEVGVAIAFVYQTTTIRTPVGLCGDKKLLGIDVIRALGPVALCQVFISLAGHYLIMVLHSEIQHSTCQALTGEGPDGDTRLLFGRLRPEHQSLYVPPPPADAGLCRAWMQLGGGLPLLPFPLPPPLPPVHVDEYRILGVLGGGTFGVVVSVEALALAEGGAPQFYAMKLLNTSTPGNRRLAHRETAIYSSIWLKSRDVAPGYCRVGHPNIVRLHFWSLYDRGREFLMHDRFGGTTLVLHPNSRVTRFHMALMMELCETNLEDYITNHYDETEDWFRIIVHFLAQMQLALAFLHEANMTYRDLKPQNVLVVGRPGTNPSMPDVHCKLGDFGYGREVDPTAENYRVSIAGTPYFCAPEMEERVRNVAFVATQEQENTLDTYSYGTVGYALGFGPRYTYTTEWAGWEHLEHLEGGPNAPAVRVMKLHLGIVVHGAAPSSLNGFYRRSGECSGKPQFFHSEGEERGRIWYIPEAKVFLLGANLGGESSTGVYCASEEETEAPVEKKAEEPNSENKRIRWAHPRCEKDGPARCEQCLGCQLRQALRQRLLPLDPSGHLTDLVDQCVERQAARRPQVAALRQSSLFQGTDFDALARLEL